MFELTEDELRHRKGMKWNVFAPDVLPAWVADMDFGAPESASEALQALIDQQDFVYAGTGRRTSVPAAFVDRMRQRFQWVVDPNRVEVLSDVLQAMTAVIGAFSERGDAIMLSSPIYPPIVDSVLACGRVLADIPMKNDADGFQFDFPAIEQRLAQGDIGLFVLCNPQNPTGRVFSRSELLRVAELAEKFDFLVVADEIHADLVFPGAVHTVFADLSPETAARTITLTSATKAFNLGGLRCAVAHFGTEELHARFKQTYPDRLLGRVSVTAADATAASWALGQPWLDDVLRLLDMNRKLIRDWVQTLPGVAHMHEPDGTYFAWLHVPHFDSHPLSAAEFFLNRARVALSPGEDFGPDLTGWVRLNFATSQTILKRILNRMNVALVEELTGENNSEICEAS
jgi:cysteine-S-conjugate beta-lyase